MAAPEQTDQYGWIVECSECVPSQRVFIIIVIIIIIVIAYHYHHYYTGFHSR